MTTAINILVIAIIANIATDIYGYALEKNFGKPRDWHMVGRWLANLFKGSLTLDTKDQTLAFTGELVLGWVFHYIIAIVYAAMYLVGIEMILGEPPSLGTAVGFGILTVAAPWFILMPGLGAGVFAKNAARPNFLRITSFLAHTVFGIGIYLGCLILNLV